MISFVIPVRNDADRLGRCLATIRAAHVAGVDVEVVVVDNGSTDPSPAVARQGGARVFAVADARVSELRNRGAQAATGDILAFVDADHELGTGWISAAVEILATRDVSATGALCLVPPGGTWVQRGYGVLRGTTRGQQDVTWLGSGNLAIRREAFDAVGGFDTALEACEDVDLCNRLRAAGFRIVGDARLENVHLGDPRTLADLFRSERWRGRDNLRVSFRRPWTWGSIPSAVVPIVDVALLVVAVLGVAGWIGGAPSGRDLALAALVVLALPALVRAARGASRERRFALGSLACAFVVAVVYDVARACALLTRAPHRSSTPRAAAAPTS